MRGSSRLETRRRACIEQAVFTQLAPQPAGAGLELANVLEALRHTLGADNVAAYRPEIYEQGWDLALSCWVGANAAQREQSHRRYVQASDPEEPSFAAFDPFAVQDTQQNRALTTAQLFALETSAASRHDKLFSALRSRELQQLRMLVCEGPRLLGWIGVLREAPFDTQDVATLQGLAEPLRRHLLVQRKLANPGMQNPLVESLLDALEQPAFFFSGRGTVEFENQRARELVSLPGGRELLATLRRAVVGKRAHPAFTLTPLRGFPGYTLALYTKHERGLAQALATARTAWQLSARQVSFLEHLAHGLSNKDIAAQVGCAEVTVEKQLTQLFRSAGARSRTELIARLHAL